MVEKESRRADCARRKRRSADGYGERHQRNFRAYDAAIQRGLDSQLFCDGSDSETCHAVFQFRSVSFRGDRLFASGRPASRSNAKLKITRTQRLAVFLKAHHL